MVFQVDGTSVCSQPNRIWPRLFEVRLVWGQTLVLLCEKISSGRTANRKCPKCIMFYFMGLFLWSLTVSCPPWRGFIHLMLTGNADGGLISCASILPIKGVDAASHW